MGLKAKIRKGLLGGLKAFSYFTPSSHLIKISKLKHILPFYHTVSNNDLPHIKHLYPVKKTRDFEEDLDFLLKHFHPVDYDRFKNIATGKTKPTKPVCLLSFDDGLRELYDIICPILIKKGIPAICFLNSAFIDNKSLFFRYKASLILEETIKEPKKASIIKSKYNSISNLHNFILSIKYEDQYILNDIASLIQLDFNQFLTKSKPYLTSHQINKLIAQGFNFGAHSVDHPEYQRLSIDNQLDQTISCLNFLKINFDISNGLFSFPFTDVNVGSAFFEKIQPHVTATFGCAGFKKEIIKNHFQRIPLEKGTDSAEEIIKTEILYYFLKMSFGKNTIYR